MFCFSSSAAAAAGLISEMLGSGANQANLMIGKFNQWDPKLLESISTN